MKKNKLLRFGHCYINKAGSFTIALLSGNKNVGYQFAGSHASPPVNLRVFQLLSRVVPNDGNWTEISPQLFNSASVLHGKGFRMEVPS